MTCEGYNVEVKMKLGWTNKYCVPKDNRNLKLDEKKYKSGVPLLKENYQLNNQSCYKTIVA